MRRRRSSLRIVGQRSQDGRGQAVEPILCLRESEPGSTHPPVPLARRGAESGAFQGQALSGVLPKTPGPTRSNIRAARGLGGSLPGVSARRTPPLMDQFARTMPCHGHCLNDSLPAVAIPSNIGTYLCLSCCLCLQHPWMRMPSPTNGDWPRGCTPLIQPKVSDADFEKTFAVFGGHGPSRSRRISGGVRRCRDSRLDGRSRGRQSPARRQGPT